MELDQALTSKNAQNQVLVCSIYEDEKPLQGTTGLLDWRLRGQISKFISQKKISGTTDELVYLPIYYHNQSQHILLVGLGKKNRPPEQLQKTAVKISEAIAKLKFEKAIFSKDCFNVLNKDAKTKTIFKKIDLEFME